MWYCNLILKARQVGISTFVSLLFLDRCLFNSNQHAGIIAHTREDAEMLFRRVKFAYDSLPAEIKTLRMANTDNARELQLSNGSTLRVGTSMRSSTLQYLHISEFGKICAKYPDKAREIVTGALNWWYQVCGQEIHLLEYYELNGEPLMHYLHIVKSKPYTYGRHIVPHDAAAHEYSTGLSRIEVARNHGIVFTIAPDLALIDGIDAARNLLNRCWFDEVKCVSGIKALESYKKEWNDRYGCRGSKPLHNFASHGADAFRMMAVNFNRLNSKGLTAEEWKSLRLKYVS